MAEPIDGLSALADRFDHFVFDVWGVLHGGEKPYDGVMETLGALRGSEKRLALLTNAPVRERHVARHLEGLGFAPDTYDALVTSGEVAFGRLVESYADAAMYLIGPAWSRFLHDDLPVRIVDDIDDADVIVAVGLAEDRSEPEHYRADLTRARERQLPFLCANPDRRLLTQMGTYDWCAGALADLYEAMEGSVEWIGKPDPEVFHRAARAIGAADASNVLMVGDGLPTDVAGANAAGATSVLLTRGIHSRELGIEPGAVADAAALQALFADAPGRPDYVMPTLAW